MTREFTVSITRDYTFREGWGVYVEPLWAIDEDDNESIAEITVEVLPIRESDVVVVGGAACLRLGQDAYVPVDNFERLGGPGEVEYGDTHDLRSRYFETEQEARDHAEFTEQRFRHPQPWESFIRV